MGCTSSKRIEASVAADVYRPAVFDINAIQEPWLTDDRFDDEVEIPEKPPHVPSPIALEKLNNSLQIDDEAAPPRTWEEVSKDLEVIKPILRAAASPPPRATITPRAAVEMSPVPEKKVKRRSFSFHTLEELETKVSESKPKPNEFRRIESMDNMSDFNSVKSGLKKFNSVRGLGGATESRTSAAVVTEGYKPVRENIFLLKDRMERHKEGKEPGFIRRDPLADYPEKCPPGGSDSVVVYTTSLGGVRRTYEDCYKVRSILELHRVVFDERDVSLHGEFLSELKELVGEGESVPRLFVKGRYIGGVDEVVSLNESGRLRRIWNWVGAERGSGRQGCEGCGGARFVPCLDCGGSCKVAVVVEGKAQKQRCLECNENGLVHCPACL